MLEDCFPGFLRKVYSKSVPVVMITLLIKFLLCLLEDYIYIGLALESLFLLFGFFPHTRVII